MSEAARPQPGDSELAEIARLRLAVEDQLAELALAREEIDQNRREAEADITRQQEELAEYRDRLHEELAKERVSLSLEQQRQIEQFERFRAEQEQQIASRRDELARLEQQAAVRAAEQQQLVRTLARTGEELDQRQATLNARESALARLDDQGKQEQARLQAEVARLRERLEKPAQRGAAAGPMAERWQRVVMWWGARQLRVRVGLTGLAVLVMAGLGTGIAWLAWPVHEQATLALRLDQTPRDPATALREHRAALLDGRFQSSLSDPALREAAFAVARSGKMDHNTLELREASTPVHMLELQVTGPAVDRAMELLNALFAGYVRWQRELATTGAADQAELVRRRNDLVRTGLARDELAARLAELDAQLGRLLSGLEVQRGGVAESDRQLAALREERAALVRRMRNLLGSTPDFSPDDEQLSAAIAAGSDVRATRIRLGVARQELASQTRSAVDQLPAALRSMEQELTQVGAGLARQLSGPSLPADLRIVLETMAEHHMDWQLATARLGRTVGRVSDELGTVGQGRDEAVLAAHGRVAGMQRDFSQQASRLRDGFRAQLNRLAGQGTDAPIRFIIARDLGSDFNRLERANEQLVHRLADCVPNDARNHLLAEAARRVQSLTGDLQKQQIELRDRLTVENQRRFVADRVGAFASLFADFERVERRIEEVSVELAQRQASLTAAELGRDTNERTREQLLAMRAEVVSRVDVLEAFVAELSRLPGIAADRVEAVELRRGPELASHATRFMAAILAGVLAMSVPLVLAGLLQSAWAGRRGMTATALGEA